MVFDTFSCFYGTVQSLFSDFSGRFIDAYIRLFLVLWYRFTDAPWSRRKQNTTRGKKQHSNIRRSENSTKNKIMTKNRRIKKKKKNGFIYAGGFRRGELPYDIPVT